ncbi:hypothetical protein [Erwinia tracheiphila]|nr:hypothetical protein [Erwinia tracheiphila]EOS92557.1 glucarate dehydratase [Erwinia tracheiphila PSU-1]UIA92382.1 hypothetical protein LU632_01355 [Erwinia tracheiphila]
MLSGRIIPILNPIDHATVIFIKNDSKPMSVSVLPCAAFSLSAMYFEVANSMMLKALMARIEKLNALYCALSDKNRNDAPGTPRLINHWHFDAHRPALLRKERV